MTDLHWIMMNDFVYFSILFLYVIRNNIVLSEPFSGLNEYVSYFEPLNYNKNSLHNQHLRRRRSLDENYIQLGFNSHNKSFQLRLKPDENTLKGVEFYFDGVSSSFDLSHIYSGFVEGTNDSYVHGSIIDGVFAGRIYLSNETFFVEKSEVYLSGAVNFHSVIYSEKNVINEPNKDRRHKREQTENHASCGMSHGNIHDWMNHAQNSAINLNNLDYEQKWLKYSYHMNRRKRAAGNLTQCSLYLQTDYTLWKYMESLNYPQDRIKAEITSLLATHVDGINGIYGKTTFVYDSMGPYIGFNFVVHRVQVNSSASCRNSQDIGFCKPNLDASNFLNIHSLTNHDPYCLAFVFSYRQFTQGTIGLAWVGSPGSNGGVCERWKPYVEQNSAVYKSLNTGIVTLCNYNVRVPLKVSILTFAHEVGHNFGSPHDFGKCIPLLADPSNKMGNYLMFSSATSGLQENNNKFSDCSIRNITLNLNSIFKNIGGRFNCFTEREYAFCGNGIVETDHKTNKSEECDCGFENDCLDDKCCIPRKEGDDDINSLACTRTPGSNCSKSEGPCCNSSTCGFVTKGNLTCKMETECSYSSQCDGSNAKCPKPAPKENNSPCNKNNQICVAGECTQSICERIHWKVCYAQAPPDDKKFDRGLLCFVSCINPSSNSCVSTGNKYQVNLPENANLLNLLRELNLTDSEGNPEGIQMPAGAPCDNFRGYCDVFYKCRAVNEEGPLAQLKKLLFNEETISQIRKWITTYWWVILLAGIGLVVFMGLFIKCCAVHTPSSNPKLKKARQLSLRRKRRQQPDMKLTVSSISTGADILRGPHHKTSRNL